MTKYYTTGQAAKVLGVCIRTVQLWGEAGRIESWKTSGGHRRLSRKSVHALHNSDPTPDVLSTEPSPGKAIKKFLIVDDSKADSRLLTRIILSVFPDAEITEAEDGFEALIRVGKNPPDILLADLDMPNMNGLQMIQAIHQQLGNEKPILIITTAYDSEELKSLSPIPPYVAKVFHKPLNIDLLANYLTQIQ
ncbi:response regulator [uncultured Amphritea sp.]|uniref:response regulator n=1 Tax=uncultured Amphritea sp. TaxID=981605 RepID=UPI00262FE144|nr:response regulator [uncultured Amphritea sp.]